MHPLVTQEEINILSGEFEQVFTAFANRSLVVWKKPIEISLSAPSVTPNGIFGFNNGAITQNLSYIPVSGIFPCQARYMGFRHIGEAEVLEGTNSLNPIGQVKVKVRQDCHDYIESGQTDKLTLDQRDWYFAGKYQTNVFMGTTYFIYQLSPQI